MTIALNPTLLASAPSLEDLRKAVSDGFYKSSKTFVPTSDTTWKVIGTYDGKEVPHVRVRLLRRRYRFEVLAA